MIKASLHGAIRHICCGSFPSCVFLLIEHQFRGSVSAGFFPNSVNGTRKSRANVDLSWCRAGIQIMSLESKTKRQKLREIVGWMWIANFDKQS